MPNYIKTADSSEKIKIEIKQWTPNNCTGRCDFSLLILGC